jgi:protein-S-isoprenylcysteine O-methyltransferase Ste14
MRVGLALRALLAVLALPGVVAGLAPWLLADADPWQRAGWTPGLLGLGGGLLILTGCVRDFYVAGRGTLAPWDPPRQLVVVGLYCFTRNPMYLGVLALVAGWGLLLGSPLVLGYGVGLALAFHLQVRLHEEPWLARQFPADWARYAAEVPRWRPRLTAWRRPDTPSDLTGG